MVTPEIVTTRLDWIVKISIETASSRLRIVNLSAPGPVIVTSWLMKISALVSSSVAGRIVGLKLISVQAEVLIFSRRLPGTNSSVVVTVHVRAQAGAAISTRMAAARQLADRN